jgi:hypothetical protein
MSLVTIAKLSIALTSKKKKRNSNYQSLIDLKKYQISVAHLGDLKGGEDLIIQEEILGG